MGLELYIVIVIKIILFY